MNTCDVRRAMCDVRRDHVRFTLARRASARPACLMLAGLLLFAGLPGAAHHEQADAGRVTITLVRWPFT